MTIGVGGSGVFSILVQTDGCRATAVIRGRPLNAPAAFIHPCQPIVAKQPHSARAVESQ